MESHDHLNAPTSPVLVLKSSPSLEAGRVRVFDRGVWKRPLSKDAYRRRVMLALVVYGLVFNARY